MAYDITEEQREAYRQASSRSRRRKRLAQQGGELVPVHPVNRPRYDPAALMPQLPDSRLRALSLFSGGGGLDLGFQLAGFDHVASYEILEVCGKTLRSNRPGWRVCSGNQGDVTKVDWRPLRGTVDLVHGGPPCQPFSIAGHRQGRSDSRDMWPEFVRAVNTLKPVAFVAENVTGLIQEKFLQYVDRAIIEPLGDYATTQFLLDAAYFGVPQQRKRVFFVGFRSRSAAKRFKPPEPTHTIKDGDLFGTPRCMRIREALGLPDIGYDDLSPTLRSGFTGPRKTTGVINSKASLAKWEELRIWPHGVAATREDAHRFPPENGHFRLSVQDCALIQGFPASWRFTGAVYQVLGQVGNSVCPPVAYRLAVAVREALSADKG
jgi:DNA (cytosine-5)-methyltransferase 1